MSSPGHLVKSTKWLSLIHPLPPPVKLAVSLLMSPHLYSYLLIRWLIDSISHTPVIYLENSLVGFHVVYTTECLTSRMYSSNPSGILAETRLKLKFYSFGTHNLIDAFLR